MTISRQAPGKTLLLEVFYCFSIVLITSLILLLLLAQHLKLPFLEIILIFFKNLQVERSYNSCYSKLINDRHPYFYLYLIISFSSLIAILANFRFKNCKRKDKELLGSYLNRPFIIAMIVFISTISVQSIHNINNFLSKDIRFRSMSSFEKRYFLFGSVYAFAMQCRRYLPGMHVAEFDTDLKLDRDPGMTTQRRLAYFLYPIDIRVHPPHKAVDVHVFYQKDNAGAFVPEGEIIRYKLDEESLLSSRVKGN
ncbi:MAG: hypothetical protein KJ593_06655 [Candidatus Omnitrophica bacterium]|nr:hypothetical protein [Candidatus Omnitrophota bacterium]